MCGTLHIHTCLRILLHKHTFASRWQRSNRNYCQMCTPSIAQCFYVHMKASSDYSRRDHCGR